MVHPATETALAGGGQGETIIVHALSHEVIELIPAFSHQKGDKKLPAPPSPILVAVIDFVNLGMQAGLIVPILKTLQIGYDLMDDFWGYNLIELVSGDICFLLAKKAFNLRFMKSVDDPSPEGAVWWQWWGGTMPGRSAVMILVISRVSSILDDLNFSNVVNNEFMVLRE